MKKMLSGVRLELTCSAGRLSFGLFQEPKMTEARPPFRVFGATTRVQTHFRLALRRQIDLSHFPPIFFVRLPIIARGFPSVNNQSEPDAFSVVFGFTGNIASASFSLTIRNLTYCPPLLQKADIVVVVVVDQ